MVECSEHFIGECNTNLQPVFAEFLTKCEVLLMIFVSLYILAFLLFFLHTETFSCVFVLFTVLKGNAGKRFRVYGPQNKRDICTIYNMSGRLVSDIETRAEGEKLISNEKFM